MKSLSALVMVGVLASSYAMADDGGFVITPRVGKTTLTINHDMLASDQRVDVNALATGVSLGYIAPFHLLIEGGYISQGNWDWFGATDKYRLSEYNIEAGFQIDTPHGFMITPRVGRSRWDLYSKDVDLTHPTDAFDPHRQRGYDNYWELSLQRKVGKSSALGVSYKDNHYGFGNVKSIAFVASIKM